MKTITKITTLLLALILGATALLSCSSASEEALDTDTFVITYYTESVPFYVAESIGGVGDAVYDSVNDVKLGKVTDLKLEDAKNYYISENGNSIIGNKFGYNSVTVTTEVEAAGVENGWMIGDTLFGIGHTSVIHVGEAEIEMTVKSVEIKQAVSVGTEEAE